jgi:hypothetical protein
VRAEVEAALGAPVIATRSQVGGFSPGTADRVELADGRRVFIKSVGAEINALSVELHRDEARMMAALPDHAPAPELLHVLDQGDWMTLVLEDIEGRQPALPWHDGDIAAVVGALAQLHAAGPVAPPAVDRSFLDTHEDVFISWSLVADRCPDDLDPWCIERLDALVEREQVAVEHVAGEALLHCDVRADNLLVRPGGDVVLVDWAWCSRGAAWLDPAELLMSLVVQGSVDPDADAALLAGPLFADAPREHVESGLLTFLGMFEWRCREEAPPGLPTLRAWQRHCADALRGWLAENVRTL